MSELFQDTDGLTKSRIAKTAMTVLNAISAALTTTLVGADIPVGSLNELAVDVNISAVSGTTPTYVLTIDRKGLDGVYYTVYTGTSQTAAGKISASIGVNATTNVSFGNTIRITETIGGTTPSFTRTISIIGK